MCFPSAVNGRRDDDANSQRHCSDDDCQGGVVLLDDFLPELIRRYEVDDDKRDSENDHAEKCVYKRVQHIANVNHGLSAPLNALSCEALLNKRSDRRRGCSESTSAHPLSLRMAPSSRRCTFRKRTRQARGRRTPQKPGSFLVLL